MKSKLLSFIIKYIPVLLFLTKDTQSTGQVPIEIDYHPFATWTVEQIEALAGEKLRYKSYFSVLPAPLTPEDVANIQYDILILQARKQKAIFTAIWIVGFTSLRIDDQQYPGITGASYEKTLQEQREFLERQVDSYNQYIEENNILIANYYSSVQTQHMPAVI